jgi:zinc transporter ZupT
MTTTRSTDTAPAAADTTDVTIDVTAAPRRSAMVTAATALVPLLVLAAIAFTVASRGDEILRGVGHNPPPADQLVVERVEFHDGNRVELDVVNPQSQPITPSMVTMDDAIVNTFDVRGGSREIGAHEHRTIRFTYDWIRDDPYLVGILAQSGVKTEVAVPAAVPVASADAEGLAWGALIGVLVGFVPVALGLAWLPALRTLSSVALGGFLAFTAGLLAFLAIDAAAEALDVQGALIPAVGGAGVVAMGIVVSMVALALVGRALRHGATLASGGDAPLTGATLALLVAIGIGLHNLGEGLAIGSSFATGEAALAISLVIGFMVHNVTEGIGIAAPLAREGQRLGIARGLGLALLAGMPAVLGIWLGRYVAGPLFTTMCFAIAAGAALQVIVEIGRSLRRSGTSFAAAAIQGGFAAGIVVMWLTGILAG